MIAEKYRRTRYPEVFAECYRHFVKLSPIERKHIRNMILRGRKPKYHYLTDKDFEIWDNFIENVVKALKDRGLDYTSETVATVCDNALKSINVGLKDPTNIPAKN